MHTLLCAGAGGGGGIESAYATRPIVPIKPMAQATPLRAIFIVCSFV
jgi:hypothetical protein